eukprot:GSMAST32.ASY1.ANO1.684.1 assembled CDS
MGLCLSNKVDPEFPAELTAKYKIGEKIGTGMSGGVFLCHRKADGHPLAVKACSIIGLDQKEVEILNHEISILKRLIEGGELFDSIVTREKYTESDARSVILSMIHALNYLHSNGIVHRDLKPENLMLVNKVADEGPIDSPIKLVDFGLAVDVGKDEFGGVHEAAGTPMYLCPECLKNKPNYGKPADVWSIGVVAYVLLCGYTPFYADNDEDLFELIKIGDVEYDPEDWNLVSDTAIGFIKSILNIDPKSRPTIKTLLEHDWIANASKETMPVLPRTIDNMKKMLARKRLRKAVSGVIFTGRLRKIKFSE